jgi:Acetyl-CoA hydrolase/transferase N-terminal domain
MQGAAEYVPIQISLVPELMARGSLPIDVAMIQVSPPDGFGYVSLGVSVNIIPSAVAAAKWVIAKGPNRVRVPFGNPNRRFAGAAGRVSRGSPTQGPLRESSRAVRLFASARA